MNSSIFSRYKYFFIAIGFVAIVCISFSLLLAHDYFRVSNASKDSKNQQDKTSSVSSYVQQRDAAITEYLLSQEAFAWKTSKTSTNICIFAVLSPPSELFPIDIWVRCGEFELQNNIIKEISGTSVPVRIDYPNELSFFDISKMSHKTPRDGSLYAQDIKDIFPQDLQDRILNFDASELNGTIKTVAKEKLLQKTSEKPITVQGDIVCLSWIDSDSVHIDLCAIGLRDASGNQYSLSGSNEAIMEAQRVNEQVTIEGVVYDSPNNSYQAQQTIRVESVNGKKYLDIRKEGSVERSIYE